jgi:hypothetical protein
MDLLTASAERRGGTLTATLTLNGPPTAGAARACSGEPATTGGLWGIEFWSPTADGNDNFYLAYQDNPANGAPGAEAGTVNGVAPSLFKYEFVKLEDGAPVAPGGTCSSPAYGGGPCTIVITASLEGLGIKPGSAIDSVTGLSVFEDGSEMQPPPFNIDGGYSNQADAAAPFDIKGTGKG